MKLIITGALGYLGSRVIRSMWSGAFDELVLIDNLSTQRHASLFDLEPAPPVKFIEADICTYDFDAVIERDDVVVHLAAITGVAASLGDSRLVDEVNVAGTLRVAAACAAGGARLLLLSSTSVYGGIDGRVDEGADLNAAPPVDPYAVSKWRAERLLASLTLEAPLQFVVARCGTIYGPSAGMRFHTAISKFCWQASTGQPITVWRTALDQRRPYLDLEDAARAIEFLIDRGRFDGATFNAVTETASVRDVIALIREVAPNAPFEFVDSAVMTSRSQTVSCDRLRSEGFAFRGGLRDGIRRTMAVLAGLRSPRFVNERQ
jgi:nucleoside-diphosphate-sugar epimerase